MPVTTVEEEGRVGYRCLCSRCSIASENAPTIEEAIRGFYPIGPDQAFSVAVEEALYLCARCHLDQLIDPEPPFSHTDELQRRLLEHVRRVAPDLSLNEGSLMRGLIDIVTHSYRISNAQLADRVHGILMTSPEDRARRRGIIDQFFAENRPVLKTLPLPVPDWCVEHALVQSANGRTYRIVEINATRVKLTGDEDIEFSRFEPFEKFFSPYQAPSVWGRLDEDSV